MKCPNCNDLIERGNKIWCSHNTGTVYCSLYCLARSEAPFTNTFYDGDNDEPAICAHRRDNICDVYDVVCDRTPDEMLDCEDYKEPQE